MEKEAQHSPGKQQLQITEALKSRLYPYQVEGLEFLHNAFREGKKGVILADEMGLGKSIQVISFLASFASLEKEIPSILLIVPTNLVDDWVSKIHDWAPGITCLIYHQPEQLQATNLRKVRRQGGVLITTYRMIIGHEKDLSSWRSSPYVWNFIVFDEAHRLKNAKTKTYKVASSLQARFRILLTGTPIQNNLKELWNLLSLISETCLVGTYQTFRKNFENPITRGREADAKADERAQAQELMEHIHNTIQQVWLRRTKDQLPKLPDKREFVLWTKLSTEQEAEYRHQLSVDGASDDHSTLKLLHNLRKICFFDRQFEGHALNPNDDQIAYSGKMTVLIALLKNLSLEGHKILVFFQYVETLKIVRRHLVQTDWGQRNVLFMDGSVELTQRTRLLKSFRNGSQSILLLTVQVGAEGLNLTTADRVIIMEPSWNQCVDAQAVDRVHRIGQKREVEVYRFITCGTVEEKMYRRQLFKGSLARHAVGDDHNPLRHFTRSELMELKSLGETQYSATQLQLEHQKSKCLSIEEILGKQLGEQISISLCGISDHSWLLKASQGEDLEAEMEKLHIAEEVQRSKEEMEGEAHLKCTIPSVETHTHKNRRQSNKRKSFKPVYSKRYSGKTPGLPRKYKQFSSPFTGSLRKKRRFPCPPQYLDPDQDIEESRDVHNSDDLPPEITFTDVSVCEPVVKPVSLKRYSGKTPGLFQKCKQFPSPFPSSVRKKRRITRQLQCISFDSSCHIVDIRAETEEMDNLNSPREPNSADDFFPKITFTDDSLCENSGTPNRSIFSDNSQQTLTCPFKDTCKEVHIDTREMEYSDSFTPMKATDTENTSVNVNDLHLSNPKAVSATGAGLLVKSQDQNSDLTAVQTSALPLLFNDCSKAGSDNRTLPGFNADNVNKDTEVLPLISLNTSNLSPVSGSMSVASTPHTEKRPQESVVCPSHAEELPSSKTNISTSSNDPHVSDDQLSDHEAENDGVLGNSLSVLNNVSANLTDLSARFESQLSLTTSDEDTNEDLETEIRGIHITEDMLRGEDVGEKDGAMFNSIRVIQEHNSYNSAHISPGETSSLNHRPTDDNILRAVSLNASQSPPQLESFCKIRESSLFPSPVPLLCDYPLTPESVSLSHTPHMEKTPQPLGVCPSSHPEKPQTEESESHSSTSLRDPQQSEHEAEDVSVLENSVTGHNNASANLTGLSTQSMLILNTADEGKSEELKAEIRNIHITDEVLRSEDEIGENGDAVFKSTGAIKAHDSYNSVHMSPDETSSFNHNPKDEAVLNTISLNASGPGFLNLKTVPISDDSVLSEKELQHQGQELGGAQAPRPTSTPVKNLDLHTEPQSKAQLESPCQISKSLFSSPVPFLCDYSLTPGSMSLINTPHMEKTPQALGVYNGNDSKEPQTERSKRHSSASFSHLHQSHRSDLAAWDVSVLENSTTAHNNASTNLTDLSSQSKLTLNTADEGKNKDLEAEIRRFHIADEVLRNEEEIGENGEASFDSPGVIKDDDSYNNVHISPEETCSVNLKDVDALRTMSLNAIDLSLSPKTLPISDDSSLSETELQHPEQELGSALDPRSTSTSVKSHKTSKPTKPQSTALLESPCQVSKSSLFSSPVPLLCDYSLTPGSVSLANTPCMEKTPQFLGECHGNDPEESQTEKSVRQSSTSFKDPHQSDDKLPDHSVTDVLEISRSANIIASDLNPAHNVTFNCSDQDRIEDPELERKSFHNAEEVQGIEEDTEKGEIHLNCPGIIKNDLEEETYSTDYRMTHASIIGRENLNAGDAHFSSCETGSFIKDNLLPENGSQHPGLELSIFQTPRSASTPVRNHDRLVDAQSPTQLESSNQILKLRLSPLSPTASEQVHNHDQLEDAQSPTQLGSSNQIPKLWLSLSSPTPLLMEKTPQVSGVCHDSDPEDPQTGKNEMHISTSFREPDQSDHKLQEHEMGDNSVFENFSTPLKNTSAHLSDLSTQCKLTLNTSAKGTSEDLDAEVRLIDIADDQQRDQTEDGEKDEATFNYQGVIKDDDSFNSVQASPEEACCINLNNTDVDALRTMSLNVTDLGFLSPKTLPISDASSLSETELQHSERELGGALDPRSSSVKNHNSHLEPQSTTQLESPCQVSKSSLFSSPVPLLCNYSFTPGSVSLSDTPRMEKTPQVLGECPGTDPEEIQTEKSERQSSTSFKDPHQSDDKLLEYSTTDILELSRTANNIASVNIRDLNPAHNIAFNYSDEDRIEDPELERKSFHNADEVQGNEEDTEKGEIHLNCLGIITNDDGDNSSESFPEETYSADYRMTHASIIGRAPLNTSDAHFSRAETVPFIQDNLLPKNESQHPGLELSIFQTPRAASTPVRNHDRLVDAQSPTQLESSNQIPKLWLSLSSPTPLHIEITPQFSGVCHGSDTEDPQTGKNEMHISTSFREPDQSENKLQEHQMGDNSVFSTPLKKNPTAHSSDLSTQCKLTLNTSAEGTSEDLEAEIRVIHFANDQLRDQKEVGEKDEATFNSQGVIKDDDSFKSVQASPEETCFSNHNHTDVNALRTMSLNATDLSCFSPKTVPISYASSLSETELQHPERGLGGALDPKSTSTKNHDSHSEPQSATQLESPCQAGKSSLFSSPVPLHFFATPGSVSLFNAPHIGKTPQVLGECPGNDPEEPRTEMSVTQSSTSFKDPHQSDDKLQDHSVTDKLGIYRSAYNTATVNLGYLNPGHVTFDNSDEGRIEDPELHQISFHNADEVQRGEEDIGKGEIHLNCEVIITNDGSDDNSSHRSPEETSSTNYMMTYANAMRRVTLNASDLLFSETSPEETISTDYRITHASIIGRETINASDAHFSSIETFPYIQDYLLTENQLQHPGREQSTIQTPRPTSIAIEKEDCLVDLKSQTQLEKPSLSFTSLISQHMERTPQVSGVCPGSGFEELQTGKSERQSNTSFRDPLKSDDRFLEQGVGDDSVLENTSTAYNNASANVTDLSTHSKLTLNTSDEDESEDFSENSVTAHIGEEVLTDLSSPHKLTLSSSDTDINEDLKSELKRFHITDEQRRTLVTKREAKCQEVLGDEKDHNSCDHSTTDVPNQHRGFCKLQ